MKQTTLLITVSSLNIVLVILILKYTFHTEFYEQNCTIEQKSREKNLVANYTLTTMQQLHQLFTTTEKTHMEISDAKGLYMSIAPALPKISTTLERLSKVYTKLSYHDRAYTTYAFSRSLDPMALIRSYCSTIKPGKHFTHRLNSPIVRSKAKKAEAIYAAYKKRALLNKISTIVHAPRYMHLRSTNGTSILN